jgi:hypothetical protein
MLPARRAAAVVVAALVCSGLVSVAPGLTVPAAAVDVLLDGGFEAATGDPLASPARPGSRKGRRAWDASRPGRESTR